MSLEDKMVESATKVATSRNEFGDVVYGATTTTSCLYRDISTLGRSQNRETVEIDGLLWLPANENVNRGDIYYHSSEGYLRIERVTKAKDLLRDNQIRFIKCEVTRQRQIS